MRIYRYVGPAEIVERVQGQAHGAAITDHAALRSWLRSVGCVRGSITCTYVVDESGILRLAERHREHVACSGGRPVRSAGELTLRWVADAIELEAVSNLSTGFCPEVESWPAVATALACLEIAVPNAWTSAYEFRRCTGCGQRNVIKDAWYVCDVCDAELPEHWNF